MHKYDVDVSIYTYYAYILEEVKTDEVLEAQVVLLRMHKIYIYIYIHTCTHVYIYIYIHISIYIHIYIYVYIMYMCIYIYIYIYYHIISHGIISYHILCTSRTPSRSGA